MMDTLMTAVQFTSLLVNARRQPQSSRLHGASALLALESLSQGPTTPAIIASAADCSCSPPKTKRRTTTRTVSPPTYCVTRISTKTRSRTRSKRAMRNGGADDWMLGFGGGGGDGPGDGDWNGGGGGNGGWGGRWRPGPGDSYGPYYEIAWLWRLVCLLCLGNTVRHSMQCSGTDRWPESLNTAMPSA